ncbi:hypothetical protein BDV12DRAFT_202673 [Aspergillus spectabilis]
MRCSIVLKAVTRCLRTPPRLHPVSSSSTRFARFAHVAPDRLTPLNPSNVNATEIRTPGITEKHWASQELPIGDRLLEPQTVVNFVPFIVNGTLPNSKKTQLPLLPLDEVEFLFRPFSEWAPAPYSANTSAAFTGIMMRIGSHEDDARLCIVGKNIHSFKSRLWEGLPPLSATRWAEKSLDQPENFDIACEYLTAAIAAFEYLGIPQVRSNLRDTFNLISGHLQEAEGALNARRIAQGQSRKPISLSALWEEYMRAKYEVMTAIAHSFVVLNAVELQIPIVQGISSIPLDDEAAMAPYIERWEKLTRIVQMADLKIWLPMDGYYGYHAPAKTVAGLHNSDLDALKQTYQEAFQHMWYKLLEARIKEQEKKGVDKQSYTARCERFAASVETQDRLRAAIRGSPACPVPRQPWIQEILRRQKENLENTPEGGNRHVFELAVYRTAHYKSSDEHWADIRGKFEAHLSTWGDGVQGSEEVKPLLKLHWFDAKELGLDLGVEHTDAAKRHFQEIRDSDTYKHKLNRNIFLVLDGWSALSYHDPEFNNSYIKQGLSPSDFQGHILAVDADFDPNEPNEHAEESPGFQGHLRILGNLVWSELYPMLTMQSASLEDLWPMAMEHPLKVYTGLTVPSQLEQWRENNQFKADILGPFVEHLKGKNAGVAKHLADLMLPKVPSDKS